jgi:hypothetical protein
MTEADWLAATDPQPMLDCLQRTGTVSMRKLQLFACACTRHIWPELTDERSRAAVEAAERYVEGSAQDTAVLQRATESLPVDYAGGFLQRPLGWFRRIIGYRNAPPASWELVRATFLGYSPQSLVYCVLSGRQEIYADLSRHIRQLADACPPGKNEMASTLRDIVGNPFRPAPAIDPVAWFASNGGAAASIASNIYGDRSFDRLPLLADALEDAGCTDTELLTHLRSPGPHVRGCWALDLVLGKQ